MIMFEMKIGDTCIKDDLTVNHQLWEMVKGDKFYQISYKKVALP